MHYTYLLKSKVKKWIYIGSTSDLKKRFITHNNGKVKSIKPYTPFNLIYYEAYKNLGQARKRELELKKNGQQKEILYGRLGLL